MQREARERPYELEATPLDGAVAETNAFFGKNEGKDKDRRANHNGRAWLQANDPDMYAFLVELYETNHDAEGHRVP